MTVSALLNVLATLAWVGCLFLAIALVGATVEMLQKYYGPPRRK